MNKLTKLSSLIIVLFLLTPLAKANFSDVDASHENYEAIKFLQENKIVEGYEDGSFRPDQKVNRAEALKIILLGSDILVPEIQKQDIFPDVLHGSWYAKFASKAKNLGVVKGDDQTGLFRPGDTVNLAEILKILLITNKVNLPEVTQTPYLDVPTDAWFASYFTYARNQFLLPQKSNENVNPATPVTRGLMAELMYQLTQKPEGYNEGEASYYGEKFHGKTTASGDIFDASGMTAAHRTFPFGTWLRVRNLENNETVDVRVNDRGPYSGDRIIDLSKGAFESISPISRGIINVAITPIEEGQASNENEEEVKEEVATLKPSHCPSPEAIKYFEEDTFENIQLNQKLPSHILNQQVLTIEGTTQGSDDEVSAFYVDENGDQVAFFTERDGNDFALNIRFPEPGSYQFGILPGRSGTTIVEDIEVVDINCLSSEDDNQFLSVSELGLDINKGELEIRWEDQNEYDIYRLLFTQSGKKVTYITDSNEMFIPFYTDFEGWQEGNVTLHIQGAKLESENKNLLEVEKVLWSTPLSEVIKVEEHHQYIHISEQAKLISLPETFKINEAVEINIDPLVNVNEEGLIIKPDGFVEEILIESQSHNSQENSQGTMVIPGSSSTAKMSFKASDSGVYFIEINNEEGQAVVNTPVYEEGVYPLIPSAVDLAVSNPGDIEGTLIEQRNKFLALINQARSEHGLAPVTLDNSMNELAQFKAEDMAKRDYFSHWTPEGLTTNELRKDYAIAQFVSENIARDVSIELAHVGLMRSAAHRSNVLNSEWKRAGLGITKDDENGYAFVQVFSDDPINFNDINELRNEIVNALNQERTSPISLSQPLNDQTQVWSDKMVSEDYFDFTAPDGTKFIDSVREAGINDTLGTYILGNSSFESAVEQIAENDQILESRWKKLGLGIKQDNFGIIKITLLYTE